MAKVCQFIFLTLLGTANALQASTSKFTIESKHALTSSVHYGKPISLHLDHIYSLSGQGHAAKKGKQSLVEYQHPAPPAPNSLAQPSPHVVPAPAPTPKPLQPLLHMVQEVPASDPSNT